MPVELQIGVKDGEPLGKDNPLGYAREAAVLLSGPTFAVNGDVDISSGAIVSAGDVETNETVS